MRPYKNIKQWTTDAKPIVYLLYFHSRVARIATQNLSVRVRNLSVRFQNSCDADGDRCARWELVCSALGRFLMLSVRDNLWGEYGTAP